MSNQTPDSRPTTITQAIEGMSLSLNAEEAKDLNASIQFHVSGDGGGDYYLTIADGQCQFSNGAVAEPTMTIDTPADVWLKIARKEMSGSMALMSGKYKASGTIGLLLKMEKLFSRKPTQAELAAKGWLD